MAETSQLGRASKYVVYGICRGAIFSLGTANEEERKVVLNLLHLFIRCPQFTVSADNHIKLLN